MDGLHHVSIDIETYSDVDIKKAGLYKYAESPAFSVLLFAYSVDGGPVQVVDLACGETIPQDIVEALYSPHYIKHAYNAAFEIECLSRYFGSALPVSQWRCTMLHGLYVGYPGSLDAVGKALGLSEDKQKMAAGKALIRYFCSPCKPTKTNGGRTRNLPHHDADKWALFKAYNAQDVVTEMEIERRLSSFPVPDMVQQQWELDLAINKRGVAVDTDLVDGALALDADGRASLLTEARSLTGLDNPNSVGQLVGWLRERTGVDIPTLTREDLADLLALDDLPDDARRVLEIRQEVGKTSNKKYTALDTAVCADNRVRGLLQFYGANRSGRWSGRLIQPQNLPRTYIDGDLLPLARDLVKRQDAAGLRLVYGANVADTLSQLIRTALCASPGALLVDADFSAIEARLIAWLAGEEWVLEVFRTHGKIYEAAAAQMFGVPLDLIKKGNPEYAYRQKGKVATLALGYQGGTNALVNMGALRMGISEADLPDIVDRWRQANSRIVQFWWDLDAASKHTVQTGRTSTLQGGRLVIAREMDRANGLDFLTIRLPSGRKLYYAQPHMGQDRFGRPSICYMGVNQITRKWERIETYGGKIAENITQSVARDCLAEAITRLEARGYRVVFHIHDEVVIDRPGATEADLDRVTEIMSEVPDWAEGLPLSADGWVNAFFKKD